MEGKSTIMAATLAERVTRFTKFECKEKALGKRTLYNHESKSTARPWGLIHKRLQIMKSVLTSLIHSRLASHESPGGTGSSKPL